MASTQPRGAKESAVRRSVDRLEHVRIDAASGLHIGTIMVGAQQLRVGIRPLPPGRAPDAAGPPMLLFNGIARLHAWLLRDARHHVFGDGHLFMLTRPQETARVIGEFLAEQVPAR